MKAKTMLILLAIFFITLTQARNDDSYTKSLSASNKFFENNKMMSSVAEAKGNAWADALNLFHDGLVIYYYNQELTKSGETGKVIGQYVVRSAWHNYGWSDHFILSDKPDFDSYHIDLPGHLYPDKETTVELDNYYVINEYSYGVNYGEQSVGKDEKRKLYYLGYSDANKDGELSQEEIIASIDDWYSNKIELIDLVEVLNLYSEPFMLNLYSESEAPSIEIVADKPYLDCKSIGHIKITVNAKRYHIIPLQDADVIVKVEPELLTIGQQLQFRGRTDPSGKFVLDNFIYEPSNDISSGGESITFSATFTDEWFNANKNMFLPNCDYCYYSPLTKPDAELSLSTNCNKYDSSLSSNPILSNSFLYTIQTPDSQQSKDELRNRLISQINSGLRLKYVIQDIESLSSTTTTTASPPTGTTLNSQEYVMGSELQTLLGHSSSVWCMAISPNGKYLASGDSGGEIIIWDINTGQALRKLEGTYGGIMRVSFSPDSRILASANQNQAVVIWDIYTGQELNVLEGHSGRVHCVAFSPDAKILASGGEDREIKLWDTETSQELLTFIGHSTELIRIVFSPDGRILASSGFGNTVKLWEANTGRPLRSLNGHSDGVPGLAFSPDGKTLASGSGDKTIKLWNISSDEELMTLQGHSSVVHCVAFSPDGKTLASGSGDKTIKLWNIGTGKEIFTLSGHNSDVYDVSFTPDGDILASASIDFTVKLWNLV